MEVKLLRHEEENYRTGGFDSMLHRFNRAVQSSGLFSDLKRKEFYEKPNEKRRRKKNEARLRMLKKLRRASGEQTSKPSVKKAKSNAVY